MMPDELLLQIQTSLIDGDPDATLGSDRLDASGRPIPGTGTFGAISSTRTAMRQLQFSLKLVF